MDLDVGPIMMQGDTGFGAIRSKALLQGAPFNLIAIHVGGMTG
jgi:hypothetical protein